MAGLRPTGEPARDGGIQMRNAVTNHENTLKEEDLIVNSFL